MKEENNGASKNKWSRIFRKKWFFPALYLTVAALLLSVVVWYQNVDNQVPDVADEQEQESDEYIPSSNDEDAEPVLDQQEVIQMPVVDQDQAEIVTKFYDYNAEQEDQEDSLVFYNNRYYQSTGIDIASATDETFDVVASLTGTVTEVKEDPLLGNVVVMTHDNDVTTYYASLDEVNVSADTDVEQGESVGTAGKNIFGKDNGMHVHFELRKDGNEVNPESFFNQSVASLDSVTDEESEASEDAVEDEQSDSAEEETDAPEEDNREEESDAPDEDAGAEDDALEDDTTDSDNASENE
ncbi:peptidoglycan DD-metalloendopeptidase family protein [Virgibacillus sp. NKC19-3]|uniref:M23 family metallopeptidase n=1 Tax=Virgibacillus saliphilus TaxID=2831674 RepID=UPI001C9B1517|nr:M23 family metallopeptidase [Virgibacillus sp. NKC19-3]MBY7144706.1 peptidoglycan DD-metalloendopeptidase family protein [Virgibacillus sp. NKC19-3]